MEGKESKLFILEMNMIEAGMLNKLIEKLHRKPSEVGFKSKNLTGDDKEIIAKLYDIFAHDGEEVAGVRHVSSINDLQDGEYEYED